ncbi:MAG: CRISPR-associated endonuclease Cas1 [Candidatus Aenigmarchaeota archaeon]|nr:CRISPR-associated endonuclease Cas1 [Candidatus Aenigmarchaeota archaeon]
MKYLLLNGHGININVDGARLHIKDGRTSVKENPVKYIFNPKMIDFDNIVIYGHNGAITFEAMRWLIKHNVQLTLLNWNGRLLTNLMPTEAKQTKLKFKQYQAYQNKTKKVFLARKIIEAKIKGSQAVLDYLKIRYPEINDNIEKRASKLKQAKTVREVMNVESQVAMVYWKELKKILNKKFDFNGRKYGNSKRPVGAIDEINALLNYGYALLESQCYGAINSTGLDTHIGYLHEIQEGGAPLVYDLQEPFRWLVDYAIINALENKVFVKKDFIRTENYNIRLRPSGAKKLTKELEKIFNMKVDYKGKKYTWAFIIRMKTKELARYLSGKRLGIDFGNPMPVLERQDTYELRQKILNLSYSEAKKMGIGKGALHDLKRRAKGDKPFKIYKKVQEKLLSD